MKVLVTGGTGFVGREIVRQLQQAGHSVRLLTRHRPKPGTFQTNAALEFHAGNVTRPETLPGAVAGTDAIIHLVGIISEIGTQTFENVHANGTRNLVEASQQAGIRRFIHMSALGTRPDAVSRYHQSKWAAEEIVRTARLDIIRYHETKSVAEKTGRVAGLHYTIFRPSLIYGPGDQFVNLFAKIIRWSPVVPVLGGTTAKFAPISVAAVAQAFARSLNESRAFGQTYDLCGPERLTMREMLGQVLEVMGKKRLLFQLPSWLARCQARVLELSYPLLLRRAPPLNRDQLIMLQEDTLGDPAPAERLFGLAQDKFGKMIGWLRSDL